MGDKPSYEEKRLETDRLNLLHDIAFKVSLDKYDEAELKMDAYRKIYGAMPGEQTDER